MSDPIFVRTRHTYDSYTDFWELVRLSGFPTIYVDEINLDVDFTYIVAPMNGEWKQFLDGRNFKDRKAKLALWNLERPGGNGSLQQYTSDNQALINEGYLDTVIISDRDLAYRTGFHFVPLGSHKGLNGYPQIAPTQREFDIIFLACYSNRRSTLFEYPGVLKKKLLNMSIAPNSWGGDRAYNLRHTKFMVNTHQDNFSFYEPLRFALAAAYKLPILTEYCADSFPYSAVGGQKTLGDLLTYVRQQLDDYHVESGYWSDVAEINYVCATTDFSFRRCIERFI